MNKRIFVWATVTIALVISYGTLSAPGAQPAVPGTDKLHHLLGFAGLVLPAALFHPRALRWVMPAAFLFGAIIELIQPYFGRSNELADLFADGAGILVGGAIGFTIHYVAKRRLNQRMSDI